MVEKVMVSCQIPQDWQEKIARLAAERKKEPSLIIYEAIAQYLGENVETTDSRLNALETDVAQLGTTVNTLQQRLHTAASIMTASYAASGRPPQKLQKEEPLADEDESEDEPDEILYGFLPPEERPFS